MPKVGRWDVGNWDSHIWLVKYSLAVFIEVKHTSTIRLAIPFLSIYLSQRNKAYVHKKTCTRMFTAALFVIAKKYKQTK